MDQSLLERFYKKLSMLSLQSDDKKLWFLFLFDLTLIISIKYQEFEITGCTDIMIRKLENEKSYQFLYVIHLSKIVHN